MKIPHNESSKIEELNKEIRRLKQELSQKYESAPDSLNESEEQYRHIVESANSCIMRLDTDGTLKFVNEFTLTFFGYTREEMIGKNVMMIIPETESSGRDLRTLIPDILKHADKYPKSENENIRKNGDRVWVSWANRIISDKHGNPVEILTIGIDITDRKKVEKKLAFERELFRGIVDNIPVMITIYDPELNNFRLNKALVDTIGWTEEDAADGNLVAKVYPDPEYRKSVIDYMQSLEPGWKEWVMTSKEGKPIDSSWANINLPSGIQIGIGIDIRERKRADSALRENEQRLQGVFNHAAIGIVITDMEDRFIEFNNRLCEILGYSREELLGKTVSELTSPEDRVLSESVNARLHHGEFNTMDYEKRYLKKDGSPVWVHVTISAIRDLSGKHINSIGTVEDITKRKEAEGRVRESEERFRAVFQVTTEGIIIFDNKGEALYVNEAEAALNGFSSQEEMMRNLEYFGKFFEIYELDGQLVPYDDWPVAKALRGESVRNWEVMVRRKDINQEWFFNFNAEPVYSDSNKLLQAVLFTRDVTDRRKAEEAIRESEEMFSNMVQAIPIGMALTNFSDRTIYKVNPAWLSITGYAGKEEVLGRTTDQLGIIRDRAVQQHYLEEFRNKGRVRNFEISIFTKTGIERNALLNLDHVHIRGQKYMMASVEDITEQKMLEQELKQKNEELTQFIYTVSHDLKSPLVTIKSFTSYLQEDVEQANKEAQTRDIGYIVNAADKMGKLLDELLELSRIGKKEHPKTEIQLKTIIQSAVDLVAGRISQRGVKVSITGPEVIVYGFQQRLMQLYQNLIDNAVKFMGDQQEPEIEIGSYVDTSRNQVVLFVRDNGSGIDPKYHHKVFGLFEKLDNKAEGSGIGLALIKRIIDVHGGDICVASDGHGKGTTFFFTLEKTRIDGP